VPFAAAHFTLSNLLGAILVLIGLYLVVTGAPAVQAAAVGEDGGFFWLLWQIIRKYPRVGIGLVLIVLGGVFLGVDFGPLIAGKKTA
jgi:hypothetical protein